MADRFEDDFKDMLETTVSWAANTGKDASGNPLYAAAVLNIPAHFDAKVIRRGSKTTPSLEKPKEKQLAGTLFVRVLGANPNDKFTLADKKVIYANEVYTFSDQEGPHHHEIVLREER